MEAFQSYGCALVDVFNVSFPTILSNMCVNVRVVRCVLLCLVDKTARKSEKEDSYMSSLAVPLLCRAPANVNTSKPWVGQKFCRGGSVRWIVLQNSPNELFDNVGLFLVKLWGRPVEDLLH